MTRNQALSLLIAVARVRADELNDMALDEGWDSDLSKKCLEEEVRVREAIKIVGDDENS